MAFGYGEGAVSVATRDLHDDFISDDVGRLQALQEFSLVQRCGVLHARPVPSGTRCAPCEARTVDSPGSLAYFFFFPPRSPPSAFVVPAGSGAFCMAPPSCDWIADLAIAPVSGMNFGSEVVP